MDVKEIICLIVNTAFGTVFPMNTAAKLFDAMIRHPLDWRIEQLQTVAQQHGIVWRHNGGSHYAFVRGDGKMLVVPAHKPIQLVYIKKFVQFVKEG